MRVFGHSSILDVVDCDPATFTRPSIASFLVALCDAIDMEREDLHFWDYDGDPGGYDAAPAHLRGVSAVQFIKTSSVVVHALDDLKAVFVDLFSCKRYDEVVVRDVVSAHFRGSIRSCHTFERAY